MLSLSLLGGRWLHYAALVFTNYPLLNNRNQINGEVPPQRLLNERTEIPSSISNKPGKLN